MARLGTVSPISAPWPTRPLDDADSKRQQEKGERERPEPEVSEQQESTGRDNRKGPVGLIDEYV